MLKNNSRFEIIFIKIDSFILNWYFCLVYSEMNSITIKNNIVTIPNSLHHSLVDKRKKELNRLCQKYAPLDSFTPINDSIFDYTFTSMDDLYFTVFILSNQLKFEVEVKYGSNKYQKKIKFRCKHIDGCNFLFILKVSVVI